MSAYLAVSQARDFCLVRGLDDSAFDDTQFAALLLRASELLDQICTWRGTKKQSAQARDWPRHDVRDGEGALIQGVPHEVISVTISLALQLGTDEREAHRNCGLADGVIQERVGDIQVRYTSDKYQLPPILRQLWPLLRASQAIEITRA